jgi:hypothetical protein
MSKNVILSRQEKNGIRLVFARRHEPRRDNKQEKRLRRLHQFNQVTRNMRQQER